MSAPRRWTPVEIAGFLDAVRGSRLEAAWHLIAFAGLRPAEVLALRWDDVDLVGGRIEVRHAVTGVAYGAIRPMPVSNYARALELPPHLLGWCVSGSLRCRAWRTDRVVPEPDSTGYARLGLLARHRERQLAERSEWGAYYATHDLVVCSENGRPIHPRALAERFAAVATRASLPPIRLGSLRGTARIHSARTEVPA